MAAAVAATSAIAGAGVAIAPAAMADTICGSGYTQFYSSNVYTSGGLFAGTVKVFDSPNNYKCAYFTVSSGTKGSAGWGHSVNIEPSSGGTAHHDSGYYNSYAGPLYAGPGCVDVWASVYGAEDGFFSKSNLCH
ncbi:hypothetical protein AB0L00_26595 [Actinoallomurus sp. NPDC052308]|uniref:hypothetical protein n=1 Tax=Actinoallomurus sp. NPDC052308 TaxID=3155530 RepID=UPI00343E2928